MVVGREKVSVDEGSVNVSVGNVKVSVAVGSVYVSVAVAVGNVNVSDAVGNSGSSRSQLKQHESERQKFSRPPKCPVPKKKFFVSYRVVTVRHCTPPQLLGSSPQTQKK